MREKFISQSGKGNNGQRILTTMFFGIVAVLAFMPLCASGQYRGTVYSDLNLNRQMDPGEKGIPDIAVTDGMNVVLTGSDGSYSLPGTERTRFIYVTVPSGYRTTEKFYLRSDNPLPSYDFGLVQFPASAKKKVRFIQLADTETGTDYGWINPIRNFARNEEVSFIIHTGDICYEYGLSFHGANVTGETMGVPVFYCVGNHDLVKGSYGEELFERNFGPAFYSFDAGNTHFIVTPMLSGDYKPSYTREDVYRWMANDLRMTSPTKNLVVFNHNLLTMDGEFIYGINDSMQISLNDHNLKAWIYGHWHSNYLMKHGESGIVSVCTAPPNKGGIDHSLSNFPVYEIDEAGVLSVRPMYNFLDNHFAAVSPSGVQCITDSTGRMLVSVNTYTSSSPAKSIEVMIEGMSRWAALEQRSAWNWSAWIPAKHLARGVPLRIEYRTSLRNGEIFTSARTFVIPSPGVTDSRRGNNQPDFLKLKWIVNQGSGSGICSPLCIGNKLFVASWEDYGSNNKISAYESSTGRLLWQYYTDHPVKNMLSHDGQRLYATDEGAVAYAIDMNTGDPAWKTELGVQNVPLPVNGGAVDEGVYYCGYGNYLSALRCRDGSTVWKNTAWNGGEGTTSAMTVCGSTLIAGSNWRALYGHDITTGGKKWEVSSDGLRFCNGTPALADDTLFVTAERTIVKMDPATGRRYSVHPVPYDLQVASRPLVTANMIISGSSAGGMIAWDRYTMKELWKVKPGPALVYTAPYSKPPAATVESSAVPVGKMIVFGASDGYLYAADPASGTVITRINLGAPILGTPCLAEGCLYVADLSGNISCFSITTGAYREK